MRAVDDDAFGGGADLSSIPVYPSGKMSTVAAKYFNPSVPKPASPSTFHRYRWRRNQETGATSLCDRAADDEKAKCKLKVEILVWICSEAQKSSVPGLTGNAHTVGNVMLTPWTDAEFRRERGGRLLLHEDVHVTQWSRYGGYKLFLAAYAVQSKDSWKRAWIWAGDSAPACYNAFEVEANLADGGYDGCKRLPWYDDPNRYLYRGQILAPGPGPSTPDSGSMA